MESKARLLGHSVHHMLVAFPVGLLLASVAFDAVAQVLGSVSMLSAAYWMLAAGILGGLIAAPFGLVDLMAIPARTRASRLGSWHAVGNVVALCLFISSWALRPGESAVPPGLAVFLSLAGGVVILMTAWLGGELISRLGVGVSAHAHVNAASSLRGAAEIPVRVPMHAPTPMPTLVPMPLSMPAPMAKLVPTVRPASEPVSMPSGSSVGPRA